MTALHEGDRISNYILEQRVGSGSFGEVWRARHHVFTEVVAIKVPTDPQYVRNLQREGVAVHGLRHPNIVRALDLDPYGSPPYLVMEYVDGPSLRQVINQLQMEFPIDVAVTILRGMLQALGAAHEGNLIHRDVKPANILLNCPLEKIEEITEQAVKVTDFGLGQAGGVTTQSIMQSGSMLTEGGRSISGTLAYMSPEQKEGKEVDGRSDLYACGIVLFEMLTGERPQGWENPSSLRPEVPAALDEVFRRAYTRWERRFSSAAEMLGALASAQGAPPVSAARAVGRNGRLHCPACNLRVQDIDQFCIRCGQQLVEHVPRCPQCRGFVQRNDRYCIFCGCDLQERRPAGERDVMMAGWDFGIFILVLILGLAGILLGVLALVFKVIGGVLGGIARIFRGHPKATPASPGRGKGRVCPQASCRHIEHRPARFCSQCGQPLE